MTTDPTLANLTETLPHIHDCLGDDCDNLNDVPCFDVGPPERHEAMYELCAACIARYRNEEPDDGHEEQDWWSSTTV